MAGVRKGTVIWGVALLILSAWAVSFAIFPYEPSFQDKPLSYWFQEKQLNFYPPVGSELPSEEAFRELGERALPFLLKKIEARNGVAQRLYWKLWKSAPVGWRAHLPKFDPGKVEHNRIHATLLTSQILYHYEVYDLPRLAKSLERLLQDDRSEVRVEGRLLLGNALTYQNPSPFLPLVKEALEGSNDEQKRELLMQFRFKASPQASSDLIQTLQSLGDQGFLGATRSLIEGGVDREKNMGLLLSFLSNGNPTIRKDAILQLGILGTNANQATPILLAIRPRLEEDLKRTIDQALSTIQPGFIGETNLSILQQELSVNPIYAANAILVLASNDSTSLEMILERVENAEYFKFNGWVLARVAFQMDPSVAPRLVHKMTEHLKNPESSQFKEIEVLGKLGTNARSSLPMLSQKLWATNYLIRHRTALAILQIGPQDEIQENLAFREFTGALNPKYGRHYNQSAIRSLGQLGPMARAALPQIAFFKTNSWPPLREAAIETSRILEGSTPPRVKSPETISR